MRFTYIYRSSDGQRHEAVIDAPSRDEAFAELRGRGVKPIKLLAADGSKANGLPPPKSRRFGIPNAAILSLVVAATVGGTWWFASKRAGTSPLTVITPQGPVTYSTAVPLPRQTIPGDRHRIEDALKWNGETNSVFRSPAESFLARHAEPGRRVLSDAPRPSEEDFAVALEEPIRIASTDFTEIVDLKRMVEGMKREMRAYLAGGGTLEGYLDELERRQSLEISYRENAESRLERMLEEAGKALNSRFPAGEAGNMTPHNLDKQDLRGNLTKRSDVASVPQASADSLKAAFNYWLKANARLKSMGIYELPLPYTLRNYQLTLDFDE